GGGGGGGDYGKKGGGGNYPEKEGYGKGGGGGYGGGHCAGTVGWKGKNNPADVQAVQYALNEKANAGLNVDGKCGPKTIYAIKAYQATLGGFKPDGLITPGKSTARALGLGGGSYDKGGGEAGYGKGGGEYNKGGGEYNKGGGEYNKGGGEYN